MLRWTANRLALAAALSAMTAMAGCREKQLQEIGSAQVMLTAEDLVGIDHVKLSITGGAQPISQDLERTDEAHYKVTVASIPAGTYAFTATAFSDAAEVHRVLTGHVDNVAIYVGQTAQVTIVLRDLDVPTDQMKKLPVIDGFSASALVVDPGAVVGVSITAHSPENHTLAYQWQARCTGGANGSFADATAAATSWTAPALDGTCQLSVRVGDAANMTSVTAHFVVSVRPVNGSAIVNALVDTYPMITLGAVDASIVLADPPAGLAVGITADVVATGGDADGSPVTFHWSSTCGGTFSPDDTSATVRFHVDDPRASCALYLAVADNSTPANIVNAVLVIGNGSACPCPPVSDLCHVAGGCDPNTGLCASETPIVCPAGSACSLADGQCYPIDLCAGVVCSLASDLCHVGGACDRNTGTCSPETPVACPAGQTCSVADGQCHPIDLCAGVTCPPASDLCHWAGTCHQGTCSPETPVVCPTGQACSVADGVCHLIDLCAGVVCPPASDLCHVAGTCGQGKCSPETPVACPSGQTCRLTDGRCTVTRPVAKVAKPIPLSRIDAVAMDSAGATYITGPLYTPTKYFDSLRVTSAGSSDMFFAKYDPSTHNAVWARAYGDSHSQMSAAATVAQDGTLAGIGRFDGTLPAANNGTVSDPQYYAIDFLMGVDSATGNVKWTNIFDNGSAGAMVAVAANPSRNILAVCGSSSQASDMVTPAPTYGGGARDAVIAAFDSSGRKLWARELGGGDVEQCSALAVDANGDVYAAGRYNGLFDLGMGALPNPGASTNINWLWVAKLNGATGATMSSAHFEGHNPKTRANAGNHAPSAIAVDSAGNVAVVGSFTSYMTFGSTALASAGGTDAFIAKLDANLAPVFALRLGGTGADAAGDVAFDAAGDLVVGGSHVGATTGAAALTAPGTLSNAFLLKLDPAGATQFSASYGDDQAQSMTRVSIRGSAVSHGGVSAGGLDLGGGVAVTNSVQQGFLVFGSLE